MKNQIEKIVITCDSCKGKHPDVLNCRRCRGRGVIETIKHESLSENAKVLME